VLTAAELPGFASDWCCGAIRELSVSSPLLYGGDEINDLGLDSDPLDEIGLLPAGLGQADDVQAAALGAVHDRDAVGDQELGDIGRMLASVPSLARADASLGSLMTRSLTCGSLVSAHGGSGAWMLQSI
jgi:hypothetical protein